jgi:putative ABC transport system permease protein
MMRLLRWLAALLVQGRDAPFIRQDLDDIYERDRARGVPAGPAARRYARMLAGSTAALINATWRNMRNALLSDLRQASRSLARDRGFTAVSLGTLGLGLALSVVVAVLVNAYLVRGLPYPDSDRLFNVQYGPPVPAPPPPGLEKLDWRAVADVVELAISWDLDNFTLRGGDHAELVQGTWVTPGYVEGFGIRSASGRGFEPADFDPARPLVAVVSDRLWRTRFNGDPAIIGRTFDAYVSDRPDEPSTFTVIGVLPASHWHMNAFTDILAPLRGESYPYMVRVREGVPPAVARERLTALVRAGITVPAPDWQVDLVSTHGQYVQQVRPLLLSVATATGLVLLISCANAGVLLTLRATRRRREMAVRQALGATSGQITRVCAAEPVVIGAAATALGLGLAWAIIRAIAPQLGRYLGRPAPGGITALAIDPTTFALAVGTGVATIVLVSIVPVWVTRRTPIAMATAGGQKGATDGPGQRRARAALITVEVAACLTLLVGAGLAVRSATGILRVEMGFDADGVVVGRFALQPRAYPEPQDRLAFVDRVLSRSGELAGAQGVALSTVWPLQQNETRDAGDATTGTFPVQAGVAAVSPDYFTVLRIPHDAGRLFTPADRLGTEPVAIVSRDLATRLWGSTRVVGQHLRLAPAPNSEPTELPTTYAIVGVVADVRNTHADTDVADVYLPLLQSPSFGSFVYLRVSDGGAAERSLKQLLGSIDGSVAFGASRRLAEMVEFQRAGGRLLAVLLMVFAGFAATLALVGIYAVVAYSVKQREREIAVRLAMGADRQRITHMFVRQGALVLSVGLAMGLGGALALGRVLRAQLFGVEPTDPMVLAAMTGAFALCGFVALSLPARAAASLDSAKALKD